MLLSGQSSFRGSVHEFSTIIYITNRFFADRTLEPKIVLEPKEPSTSAGMDLTCRRTARNTLMYDIVMISVGTMKLITVNASSKSAFSRRNSATMFIQSKRTSVTPELVAPPTTRLSIQIVEMIARRTRSVKMVKWVRGRTITVHLTTDTAARCQMEHMPEVIIPLWITLSNHVGTSSPGCSDHATPAQQTETTPLRMSEAASDAITFATESLSKRRLRNVTRMTGMLAANVARDICTGINMTKRKYGR